jgi:hypothetical protein
MPDSDPRYLRRKITEMLKEHPIGLSPEGEYVPDSKLDQLLAGDAIGQALGKLVKRKLVKFVLDHAKKTFATWLLVFMEGKNWEQALNGFSNMSPPFTDGRLSSQDMELCQPLPCKRERCTHFFPYEAPWDLGVLNIFMSKRWHFLVPTFDHTHFIYDFDIHQLLPFTKKVLQMDAEAGNFGEVTCVEMLANKQTKIKSPTDETIRVVLKRLRRIKQTQYKIDKEWRREAKAYRGLSDKSEHIIRGIAAYRQLAADEQDSEYYLVLEWADEGNLLKYWNDENLGRQVGDDVSLSRKRVKEVLEQLHGLAEALEAMHTSEAPIQTPALSGRNSAQVSPSLDPGQSPPKSKKTSSIPSISAGEPLVPKFNFEEAEDGSKNLETPDTAVSPPKPGGLK